MQFIVSTYNAAWCCGIGGGKVAFAHSIRGMDISLMYINIIFDVQGWKLLGTENCHVCSTVGMFLKQVFKAASVKMMAKKPNQQH